MNAVCRLGFAMFVLAVACLPLQAAPVIFFGFDDNPTTTIPIPAHPNADAARDAFLASLAPGSVGVQTFEGIATGLVPSSLDFPSTGVTADFGNLATQSTSITNVVEFGDTFAINGTNYLYAFTDENEPYFSLTFSTPQTAIGFYAIDASDAFGLSPSPEIRTARLILEGPGSLATVEVFPAGTIGTDIRSATVLFFGVIDHQTPFTKVTLFHPTTGQGGNAGDALGIDDLTIGTPLATPVPEPAALGLVSAGAVCFVVGRGRGRRPQAE